jgi:cobalt-zinc-cadmium efflux system protein
MPDMAHDHLHGGHNHPHLSASKNFGPMFAIATAFNVGLVVLQIFYGLTAHSIALLADAGHNFGDALGLVIAWIAHAVAQRNPTARYTYGFRSASILAALLNAVILLVATGAIAWEAIQRFFQPGEVAGITVMVVASAAVVINGLSAGLLMAGQKDDLNIRGAFLHMLADAAVSLGVVIAGAVILLTGWFWCDPAASLVISAVIVWGTWKLLRESVTMSLNAVPSRINPDTVRFFLCALPGVSEIHDLHIWAMSTTETAMTCHLVMPAGHPGDEFLEKISHDLHHKFGIEHPTMQIEISEARACKLAPDHVV